MSTKVMILAAGRGARLKPLTDTLPKPLICVKNKPLIVYHLEKLAAANLTEIVINTWYLGDKIKQYLGNGSAFGVNIVYSEEIDLLETGGGVCQALALSLLGNQEFILLNGDVYTDFDVTRLMSVSLEKQNLLGHLILVPNPTHHQLGDYSISLDQTGYLNPEPIYTYSGMAKLHPNLFLGQTVRKFRLPDLFLAAMSKKLITAELYPGFWYDVGSVERLKTLESIII